MLILVKNSKNIGVFYIQINSMELLNKLNQHIYIVLPFHIFIFTNLLLDLCASPHRLENKLQQLTKFSDLEMLNGIV